MGFTEDDMVARLPDALPTEEHSGWRKFARILVQGHWSQVEQDLNDVEDELPHIDKRESFIERYGNDWGVQRGTDEELARYRVRLQGKFKRLLGGTTPEEIRAFVASFLESDESEVTITENEDPSDGMYAPARFEVRYSQTLYEDNLGAEAPFTDLTNAIDDILTQTSPVGVFGETNLTTASTWDSGDSYDDSEVYGT